LNVAHPDEAAPQGLPWLLVQLALAGGPWKRRRYQSSSMSKWYWGGLQPVNAPSGTISSKLHVVESGFS
jgi:hypothetical protein